MRRVLIFGDFDLLHPGHSHMLREAKKQANELIVAVTPSSVIRKLKKRPPLFSNKHRLDSLRLIKIVYRALLGDSALGSFSIIEKVDPDIICIGHDQLALEKELRAYLKKTKKKIVIKKISSFHPKLFKSSKLKKIFDL